IAAEQSAAQLAKTLHLLADVTLRQDLPVGVPDPRFIIDHQHANGRSALFRHGGPHATPARDMVSRAARGTSRCIDAPRPGPSLAAQIRPPSALSALAHQSRPIPWLVNTGAPTRSTRWEIGRAHV